MLLAVLGAAGCARQPAGSAACTVPHPLAVLPLTPSSGVPVAMAEVNGELVHLVVDLGSESSFLSEYTLGWLKVRRTPVDIRLMQGVGGFSRRLAAIADRVQLGGLVLTDQRFEVEDARFGDPRNPTQGLLGLDVLRKYDVDLDLPQARLTLNAPADCDAPPPGWAASPLRVAVDRPIPGNHHMTMPAKLDGRPVTALLDSGFSFTTVGAEAARAAGFEPGAGARSVAAHALGDSEVRDVPHQFHSLMAAGDTLANPFLLVGPVGQYYDMVLGADFFARHRIWIPAGGDAVWFAPAGAATRP